MSESVDIEECDWCGEERPVAIWYEDGNAPVCGPCLAAEVDRLRADLADAQRERDEARTAWEACERVITRLKNRLRDAGLSTESSGEAAAASPGRAADTGQEPGMSERLRWKIAYWVDKLPGQCWSNLVDWALVGDGLPWRPVDEGCRTDLERNGSCYCGKLKDTEGRQG